MDSEIFLSRTSPTLKIVKFFCREIFLFYSIWLLVLRHGTSSTCIRLILIFTFRAIICRGNEIIQMSHDFTPESERRRLMYLVSMIFIVVLQAQNSFFFSTCYSSVASYMIAYKDFTQLSSLRNNSCRQELATLQPRMQLTAFWAGMADRFTDISAHFEISVIGISKSLGW